MSVTATSWGALGAGGSGLARARIRSLEIKETATEIRVETPADVLFDFDKADSRPDASKVLSRAAEIIRRHAQRRLVIEGHTDAKGSEQDNQRLSERRAPCAAICYAQ